MANRKKIIAHLRAFASFVIAFSLFFGLSYLFYRNESVKEGGVLFVNMLIFWIIGGVVGLLSAFGSSHQFLEFIKGFIFTQIIFFILTVILAIIFTEKNVHAINSVIAFLIAAVVYLSVYLKKQ